MQVPFDKVDAELRQQEAVSPHSIAQDDLLKHRVGHLAVERILWGLRFRYQSLRLRRGGVRRRPERV